MAITATTGSAANSASAASLALPSFNLTAGQDVVVGVALGSTSSSVTSITDTKGNAYTSKATKNGTGIRTEIWESHSVGVQTNNIITVNVSPSTTLAAAAEEYANVTSVGNTATNSGSDGSQGMRCAVVTQNASNFIVCALGFSAQSGDTVSGTQASSTASDGTSRQSTIPAATRPGIVLFDNTMIANGTVLCLGQVSAARNWASAGLELQTSNGTDTIAVVSAPNTPTFIRMIPRLPSGGSFTFVN